MVKRFIFRILDALLVSTLIFFICYAFYEIKLDTNNSALLFSIFTTAALGLAYFIVRGIYLDYKDAKAQETQQRNLLCRNLLLLSDKAYFNIISRVFDDTLTNFKYYKNLITARDDIGSVFIYCARTALNIPLGRQELMPFVRICMNSGADRCIIVALTGIDKSGMDLLGEYPINMEIVNFPRLTQLLEEKQVIIPDYPIREMPAAKSQIRLRFNGFLTNPKTLGICIKYSLLLGFMSIFTLYKIYYIIFALLLLGFGIFSKVRIKKLQERNIF